MAYKGSVRERPVPLSGEILWCRWSCWVGGEGSTMGRWGFLAGRAVSRCCRRRP
jgi:hypothetical protein